ncbi:phosphoglucosamine mutase [Candidatus Cetobacterium colombiensis]|uniref:Phosphoglucosamine mutase n=1 Tax=Candidatus Cetobacterium colombiensis TaxID=3073100 RepID=A0ABU4W5W9_9FUSO|nr:phosphoglucosamine mutase [Candidatus Cetobacterium colombiensis]MDX8334916.1 phosphoglucosamine mutase [Candidatus Cetobacterium colombiensis]
MRKYFGTDGIRGEANKELTVELALRLGYALGYTLKKQHCNEKRIKVIMGSDTRRSGYMLRSALSAGLNAMGINIDFVGVIPTPGVAYLTEKSTAKAGIMISASHNPAKDNGIKIFWEDGYKLPDDVELEIEKLMDNVDEITKDLPAGDEVGRFTYAEDEYYIYRDHVISTVAGDFSGMKIILDAANGSAYRVAKEVFLALGAEIVIINDAPNGKNINVKCGSTHPEILSKVVIGYEADLGLAYDGDADRLIAVDKNGNIIDGDKIIAVLALGMKNRDELKRNQVVTTVMSNMGFQDYLSNKGIELIRANVGDRYVLEKMKELKINIGGEQSGHIILSDFGTTGDGVLTSVKLVEAIRDSGKSLDELVSEIVDWPQLLINVRVDNTKKNLWNKNEVIVDYIGEKEKEMAGLGRVLVRTSGTEPIVRVMVEGKEMSTVERVAKEIAAVVEKELV